MKIQPCPTTPWFLEEHQERDGPRTFWGLENRTGVECGCKEGSYWGASVPASVGGKSVAQGGTPNVWSPPHAGVVAFPTKPHPFLFPPVQSDSLSLTG